VGDRGRIVDLHVESCDQRGFDMSDHVASNGFSRSLKKSTKTPLV